MKNKHDFLGFLLFAIFFLIIGYSLGESVSDNENAKFFSSKIVHEDSITGTIINSEKYLCVQDVLAVHFEGDSMQPVHFDGYIGLVRLVNDYDSLEIGNIIIFDGGFGYMVAHRIVDIGEDAHGLYFVTKGDNNNYSDGKIRPDKVHSVVVGVLY